MTGRRLWTPDGDDDDVAPDDLRMPEQPLVSRRALLRIGAGATAALGLTAVGARLGPSLSRRGLLSANGVVDAGSIMLSDSVYTEVWPTSPLILSPFSDMLPIPKALAPSGDYTSWKQPPGPGLGQQNWLGNETHQMWPSAVGYTDPLVYNIDIKMDRHSFTSSQVLPINASGQPTRSFDASGKQYAAGTARMLPPSTTYGFNGKFPERINAEYGKPCLVRFNNTLDQNPFNDDRQDFGAPDASALIHLHNAHTAPESDGNPHYSMTRGPKDHGFPVKSWVDQLYLNWPAGNDEREKQSFFWFHDHRMDHTGSNVYKGMVGIYPIYDPVKDNGNEADTSTYQLPGVRTNNPDGSFDVDYDVPLVFFDARLDDGVTMHHDIHDAEFPAAKNPRTHPEWWGKTFYKHFPNHGFVGDLFTVNGTAYPVLNVKRRKYRFRFLDASISRIYEFKLMSSTNGPKAAKDLGYTGNELQGQYRIPDAQQCMKFIQVASDGGVLPFAISRDSFELWPAKRREVVIDFTKYQDGSATSPGDVIYLTNIMKMTTGRMWDNSSRFGLDPNYKIPMLKFVIDGKDMAPDSSVVYPGKKMRDLPPLPSNWQSMLDNRYVFEVERGGAGGEIEWLINGQPFDPSTPVTTLPNPAGKTMPATQPKNSFNLWEVRNGGGGWVHPFHLHMEEHRTVMRNGKDVTAMGASPGHPDDFSREDLIALDPSESVIIYRGFRDFVGPYVAHCHNLAHEDHAMMFGWSIT
jgi:FtsP/CotA-like multicopper oxidase with cupredoxin domain